MRGKIVSTKMDKTVIVEVERLVVHPVYKKRVKKTNRFAAHNEIAVKLGDTVEIGQTKPYSKTKKHKVLQVVNTKGENDTK